MDNKHQNQMLGLVIGLSLSLFVFFAIIAVLLATGVLRFAGGPVQLELIGNRTENNVVRTEDKQDKSQSDDSTKVTIKKFTDPNLPDFSFEYSEDWKVSTTLPAQIVSVGEKLDALERRITIKKGDIELFINLTTSDLTSGVGIKQCETMVNATAKRLKNFTSVTRFSENELEENTTFVASNSLSLKGEPDFGKNFEAYSKQMSLFQVPVDPIEAYAFCENFDESANFILLETKSKGYNTPISNKSLDKFVVYMYMNSSDPDEINEVSKIIDSIKGIEVSKL